MTYLAWMKVSRLLSHPGIRNLIGFLLLVAVHYASDQYNLVHRTGFNKISPYLFLVLLYGWIVLHNRILFEGLFLKGKKGAYFIWTLLGMGLSSLNMWLILAYVFRVAHPLPNIISFWVYTIAGLGVFVVFRYLRSLDTRVESKQEDVPSTVTHFSFLQDGLCMEIPVDKISHVESLENYVKVYTGEKTYLVRMPLKEAEERLPKTFLRISKSHIVNSRFVRQVTGDVVVLDSTQLKVGKVYKRYVEDQFQRLR